MPISDKPKQLFNIGLIDDEVMKRNFDILNRELQSRRAGDEIEPANVVYSRSYPGNSIVALPLSTNSGYPYFNFAPMVVEITTRGNPVQLSLVPGTDLGAIPSYISIYDANPPGGTNLSIEAGYYRSSDQDSNITIGKQPFLLDFVANQVTRVTIGLPAFIYEDPVPSGKYTYTFWAKQAVNNAHVWAYFSNVKLRAQELR